MKKILFWLLAFVITAASAFYQRRTGPTYPVSGKALLTNGEVSFELPRSAEITADCEVSLEVPDTEVAGRLLYQRFKTGDPWTELAMIRQEKRLVGYPPKQASAGQRALEAVLA